MMRMKWHNGEAQRDMYKWDSLNCFDYGLEKGFADVCDIVYIQRRQLYEESQCDRWINHLDK